MLAKVLGLPGQVPRAGYRLHRPAAPPGAVQIEPGEWVLTFNDDPRAPRDHRPPAALRADGTDFLEFVRLIPAAPDAVLAFANRFGPLVGWTIDRQSDPPMRFEPVANWMRAAATMHEVVGVWLALRRGAVSALRKRFRQAAAEEEFVAYGLRGTGWVYFPPADGKPQFVGGVEAADGIETAAGVWLRARANGGIEHVRPRLVVDEGNGGIVVGLMPRTLAEALWLQLAFAVCGHQEYRDCAVCGTPFGFDPGNGSNARRLYCGGSCRTAASRQKAEAAAKVQKAKKAKKAKKAVTKRKGK